MLWLVRSKACVTLLPAEGGSSLFQIAQTEAQEHRGGSWALSWWRLFKSINTYHVSGTYSHLCVCGWARIDLIYDGLGFKLLTGSRSAPHASNLPWLSGCPRHTKNNPTVQASFVSVLRVTPINILLAKGAALPNPELSGCNSTLHEAQVTEWGMGAEE